MIPPMSSSGMSAHPRRAISLDALGTLVELEPPAPKLVAALAERGVDVAPADAEAGGRAGRGGGGRRARGRGAALPRGDRLLPRAPSRGARPRLAWRPPRPLCGRARGAAGRGRPARRDALIPALSRLRRRRA